MGQWLCLKRGTFTGVTYIAGEVNTGHTLRESRGHEGPCALAPSSETFSASGSLAAHSRHSRGTRGGHPKSSLKGFKRLRVCLEHQDVSDTSSWNRIESSSGPWRSGWGLTTPPCQSAIRWWIWRPGLWLVRWASIKGTLALSRRGSTCGVDNLGLTVQNKGSGSHGVGLISISRTCWERLRRGYVLPFSCVEV